MIDWVIEAWNDYENDLREYLTNDEVIKDIENADDGQYIQGIGEQHNEYIKLAKILIEQVLNKGFARHFEYMDTADIVRYETGGRDGNIHFIFPVYDRILLEFGKDKEVMEYYYTTIDYSSCPNIDIIRCALSKVGSDRVNVLMNIAYAMVKNLRRMGDE